MSIIKWFLRKIFDPRLVEILTDKELFYKKLVRTKSLEYGDFMGKDYLGNMYYENRNNIKHRSRIVEYPMHGIHEFDATQISPEWHNWIHHKTDIVPNENDPKPFYFMPGRANQTFFPTRYMGCRTTKPKVIAWDSDVARRNRA